MPFSSSNVLWIGVQNLRRDDAADGMVKVSLGLFSFSQLRATDAFTKVTAETNNLTIMLDRLVNELLWRLFITCGASCKKAWAALCSDPQRGISLSRPCRLSL